MRRKLKRLGRALAAVCALGMVAAGVASAQTFGKETADGPVTLVGTTSAEAGSNAWTLFGGSLNCPGSTFTGHKLGSSTELIPSGSTAFTVIPSYKNCSMLDAGGSTFPATIDMNGCDYDYTIGVTTGDALETYAAVKHVRCPAGAKIAVTLFTSGSHSLRICTISIGPQTPGSEIHFTGAGFVHRIRSRGPVPAVLAEKQGLCGSATESAAVMHEDITFEGRNAAGEPTGPTITH